MRSAMGFDSLSKFKSNLPQITDEFWEPLYHFQTYTAATGHQTLSFFQTAVGAAGVTLDDTNMEIPSQIPSNKAFLATGLAIQFLPGVAVAANGATAVANFMLDMYAVFSTGHLEFNIGVVSKCRQAPVGAFPPGFGLSGVAAVADTAAATMNQIAYAGFSGRVFDIIPTEIPANQNFVVTLAWPNGAVPLPSTVDARIGVYILGHAFRLGQ